MKELRANEYSIHSISKMKRIEIVSNQQVVKKKRKKKKIKDENEEEAQIVASQPRERVSARAHG